jgi:predicted GNAT family acetyltransferase
MTGRPDHGGRALYPSAMLEVVNNETERRWEARLDGALAGYAEYRARRGRIVFTHTVVQPEFEGRGVGSGLARAALDAAVADGQRIVPYCPFIAAYLRRHAEYHAHVDWPASSARD